ncbi:MAG TPA: hypothetical protein VK002_16180, partial [Rubricoccaceae bacterium]|nr:hypothetical protein [Rubricoccaceae bacterium]
MDAIKFGTDGWRAVIADGYTFANLERVARATGQWLRRHHGDSPSGPSVVVGYDTRFQGAAFAAHAARVLGSMGVRVRLARSFVTTPAVSWATVDGGHSAGVVITASHNPPEYNGFKIKADYGGPATPEMTAEVEAEMTRLERLGTPLPTFKELLADGRIELRELVDDYLDLLRQRLDIDAIRSAGLRIAHDAMYGAGQGLVSRLLGAENVVEVRCDWNPGFKGGAPEPI